MDTLKGLAFVALFIGCFFVGSYLWEAIGRNPRDSMLVVLAVWVGIFTPLGLALREIEHKKKKGDNHDTHTTGNRNTL